jgi:ferritin-like metal-binding protein YciE
MLTAPKPNLIPAYQFREAAVDTGAAIDRDLLQISRTRAATIQTRRHSTLWLSIKGSKCTENVMSDSSEPSLEIYLTGLRNQHAVEQQAISLLSRQVERLENYPEMEARMRQHIQESEQQAKRLEELLGNHGTSHSKIKDAVTSIGGNIAALAHTVAPDEVLKNTFANFAFEHFEIAAYKSLLTIADLINQSGAASLLKQSLNEEVQMAQWIDEHLADTTRRYVERSRSGLTAGI